MVIFIMKLTNLITCITILIVIISIGTTNVYALSEIEAIQIIEGYSNGDLYQQVSTELTEKYPQATIENPDGYNITIIANVILSDSIENIIEQDLWASVVEYEFTITKVSFEKDFNYTPEKSHVSKVVYVDDITEKVVPELSKFIGGAMTWDCSNKETEKCDGLFVSHTNDVTNEEFRAWLKTQAGVQEQGTEPGIYYYVESSEIRNIVNSDWVYNIEANSIGGLEVTQDLVPVGGMGREPFNFGVFIWEILPFAVVILIILLVLYLYIKKRKMKS